MKCLTYFPYRTTIGYMTIARDEGGICALDFGCVEHEGEKKATEETTRAANQVHEYLCGKRQTFDIPLSLHGSDFTVALWHAMRAIPYGTTATATELATQIARPQSYRLVGSAVKNNPIHLIIPDHRIVDAKGNVLGVGVVERRRKTLLALERQHVQNGQNV